MVKTYKAQCNACDAEFTVKYGSKNKRKIIFETFSCPQCKNLFSLSNNDKEFSCPTCGNTDLIRYNMNKIENITYYKKMYNEQVLPQEKYEEIIDFWKNVKSDECPKCGKHELVWSLLQTQKI
jgi:DNA-directed RNA polymerase subunit M/transcription elongation factor TFIIS